MKIAHLVMTLFVCLLMSAPLLNAKEQEYQRGILKRVEVQDSGISRTADIDIQLDDVVYSVRWYWGIRDYNLPSEFIIGDTIEVRLKKSLMYIKKPKGGEVSTLIILRTRAGSNTNNAGDSVHPDINSLQDISKPEVPQIAPQVGYSGRKRSQIEYDIQIIQSNIRGNESSLKVMTNPATISGVQRVLSQNRQRLLDLQRELANAPE